MQMIPRALWSSGFCVRHIQLLFLLFSFLKFWLAEAQTKGSTCRRRRCLFDPWVGKMPWRRKWQAAPVFLPGESRGQRSLVACSPWGLQRVRHESNTNVAGLQSCLLFLLFVLILAKWVSYTYPLSFGFPSHSGPCGALNRVPTFSLSIYFIRSVTICQLQSPESSHRPTPAFPLGVHVFLP